MASGEIHFAASARPDPSQAWFRLAQWDAIPMGVILERARENPDEPTKVYRADDCIGAVVNGVCHGSVIDTDPAREKCHGAWINGQCTGPQF
jgi:hypothetical protein